MKKTMMMLVMSASLLGFSGAAFAATDYSHATDAELAALRGKMRNAPMEDRTAYRNECQKRFAEPGPDARMQKMGGSEGRWRHCRNNGLQERLGLNEKQSVQVQELQKKHFNAMIAEKENLVTLNRELREESIKAHPDKKKIYGISENIGRLHATLARLKSTHLAELATILSPAQIEKMQPMMGHHQMRGNCGMMQ
jgi:hypothetical protein